MLDPFAGTLSTWRLLLLLDHPKWPEGCDEDGSCLQMSIPSIVEVYVSQLLDDRSDFNGDCQMKKSADVHWTAVKHRRLKKSLEIWDAPPGLLYIQTFQENAVSHLRALHREYSESHLAYYLPNTSWPKM